MGARGWSGAGSVSPQGAFLWLCLWGGWRPRTGGCPHHHPFPTWDLQESKEVAFHFLKLLCKRP